MCPHVQADNSNAEAMCKWQLSAIRKHIVCEWRLITCVVVLLQASWMRLKLVAAVTARDCLTPSTVAQEERQDADRYALVSPGRQMPLAAAETLVLTSHAVSVVYVALQTCAKVKSSLGAWLKRLPDAQQSITDTVARSQTSHPVLSECALES